MSFIVWPLNGPVVGLLISRRSSACFAFGLPWPGMGILSASSERLTPQVCAVYAFEIPEILASSSRPENLITQTIVRQLSYFTGVGELRKLVNGLH